MKKNHNNFTLRSHLSEQIKSTSRTKNSLLWILSQKFCMQTRNRPETVWQT